MVLDSDTKQMDITLCQETDEGVTPYTSMTIADIHTFITDNKVKTVTFKGHDPLLHWKELAGLVRQLLRDDIQVRVETEGLIMSPFHLDDLWPKVDGQDVIHWEDGEEQDRFFYFLSDLEWIKCGKDNDNLRGVYRTQADDHSVHMFEIRREE